VLVGGGTDIDGAAIARIVGKVPAKRAAATVDHMIDDYKAGREDGEIFRNYATRRGLKHFRALIEPFAAAPKFSDDPLMFVDHEANKLFSLDEMGEGECAV
jgi:sulfite reductase beta subunit-like hemoprotein